MKLLPPENFDVSLRYDSRDEQPIQVSANLPGYQAADTAVSYQQITRDLHDHQEVVDVVEVRVTFVRRAEADRLTD